MNLDSALTEIRASFKRMTMLYGEPVFDEWVLIALSESNGAIQRYEGPRSEQFLASFSKDIAALRAELAKDELDVGGFTFGAATHGHSYDAAMRVGPAAYILGNHTTRSMEDIRARPQWLKAQVAWFGMSERFRADPLLLLISTGRSRAPYPVATNAA